MGSVASTVNTNIRQIGYIVLESVQKMTEIDRNSQMKGSTLDSYYRPFTYEKVINVSGYVKISPELCLFAFAKEK
jgi:hypothetical protein